MDKSKIINEIKLHLNIKTDSEFADFLGIKQPTIASWRKRNTIDYELIISKCNEINGHWLLTGEGEMLKNTGSISISGNNTGIANTGIITGDVSSGNTIPDSNITIQRKTENNTEDISNLLDSYNASKGVEIDRLQVLYNTMLEGKDAIIEEKNALIQELKETIQELREDKKHLKSILDKENN